MGEGTHSPSGQSQAEIMRHETPMTSGRTVIADRSERVPEDGIATVPEVSRRAWAEGLAESDLRLLPTRWTHVVSVAGRAENLARMLDLDPEILVSAAWLHDIGYSPEVADTGLHAIDGARYLRTQGFQHEVCSLVAHHTGARFEANERGLLEQLIDEFPVVDAAHLSALNYCDLTRGPEGQSMSFHERLEDIFDRYPPDDPVHRAVIRATPTLRGDVALVEAALARQSQYGTA